MAEKKRLSEETLNICLRPSDSGIEREEKGISGDLSFKITDGEGVRVSAHQKGEKEGLVNGLARRLGF